MRSIERAVSDYDVNYVLITDSVATAFKRHFLEFVAEMRASFPGVSLQLNSTVDCWDEERARACHGLSCSIWFGFESGSQRMLDFLQKGTTVELAYEAARLCRQYEIPCAFNVLVGVPGETEEDYRQTLEVFERCPWVYPNPNIFNPLPGTALHHYCEQRMLTRAEKSYDIWDAERIERENDGPVKGVDYGLVLKYYSRLTELQEEPQRSLSK
jgi:anaerobic magnesium-protoporphyrin IX monomethyl ester cyclase